MGGSDKGFILTHRKIMDNPIWCDPFYLKLWSYCLFKASYCEREVLVGNQLVKLERGQFITGRKSLAEDMNKGMKPEHQKNELTWYRHLQNLEKWQMLNIKPNNKYSIVTIDKYGFYQGGEQQPEQLTEQQLNNKRTTTEQQLNTNKELKELNTLNTLNKNKDIRLEIENFRQKYDVDQLKIIDDYLEMLRHTRVSGKIQESAILGIYKEWDKHPPICVIHGLTIHTNNPNLHSKKEKYTLGIIRNARADEVSKFVVKKQPNIFDFDLED